MTWNPEFPFAKLATVIYELVLQVAEVMYYTGVKMV
jgi:hypothetical protein